MAFLATRTDAGGEAEVVVKVQRPWFVRQSGANALKVVQKEATSLGRLNDRVPPTPFVVRMIEAGLLPVVHGDVGLDLPWIALEYVHGAMDGTTLAERTARCIGVTGHAFDPSRAARAIECIAEGLTAIHDEQIIHRDLKPDNVLCCGFGADEMFKISDFGIARPQGIALTFGGLVMGTPGYAPPEQAAVDTSRIGPWTDVFAFAAMVFHLLTGEEYFPVRSPMEAIAVVQRPQRRSILDCPRLSLELRERPTACRGIDQALARATSVRSSDRPQTARELAALLLVWLRSDSRRIRPTQHRLDSFVGDDDTTRWAGRKWTVRHRPGGARLVKSTAWSSDGRCLAVTEGGLSFWDGTDWRAVDVARLGGVADDLRFVTPIGPGLWMVGGGRATIATLNVDGVRDVIRGGSEDSVIELADGDVTDLAVFVATTRGGSPTLHALCGRRWVRELPLPELSFVSALARIDDARWLVAGRRADGSGYAGVYEPLRFQCTEVPSHRARAFLSAAAHTDRGVGLVTGTEGRVIVLKDGQAANESVGVDVGISAAAVDVAGRCWAAAAGRIWVRGAGTWMLVWEDARWKAPIVSLYADIGVVLAMTADGGIVEGRASLA